MSEFRNEYDSAMRDSSWTIWKTFTHLVLPLVGVLAILSTLFYVMGWGGEAAQVAQHELGPKAAMSKYEWFKDAAAQLSRKEADIKVYQSRITAMKADYAGKERIAWAREDREQMSVWESEVSGVISSYNGLAAEYNSASSKFNWAPFQGDQPEGSDSIPMNFAAYKEGVIR
jgi:hypothetical protein